MKDVNELSGMELREAVLQEVFGWTKRPLWYGARDWWFRPNGYPACAHDADPLECMLPAYESTWEGAGAVIEAMEQRGFLCTMDSEYEAGEIVWRINFASRDIAYCWGGGIGPTHKTLPLGVARAALQAVRASK